MAEKAARRLSLTFLSAILSRILSLTSSSGLYSTGRSVAEADFSSAGFESAVFPYTTDIPFLSAWGQPLLFGPGSVHVAHTAEEFISIAELNAAVDHYVTIARALLAG